MNEASKLELQQKRHLAKAKEQARVCQSPECRRSQQPAIAARASRLHHATPTAQVSFQVDQCARTLPPQSDKCEDRPVTGSHDACAFASSSTWRSCSVDYKDPSRVRKMILQVYRWKSAIKFTMHRGVESYLEARVESRLVEGLERLEV